MVSFDDLLDMLNIPAKLLAKPPFSMTSSSKTDVLKVSQHLLEGCFDFGSFSQKFMI